MYMDGRWVANSEEKLTSTLIIHIARENFKIKVLQVRKRIRDKELYSQSTPIKYN